MDTLKLTKNLRSIRKIKIKRSIRRECLLVWQSNKIYKSKK
jgi:hypothetical protein